jgi:hypothetical protein
MQTKPLTTIEDGKHYILLTSSDVLRDEDVTDWDGVVNLYHTVVKHLSNFAKPYEVIPIPVILEVVSYTPPKKWTPQDTRRVVATKKERKQPTGWFHHKSPGTDPVVKANGVTLDWDEGHKPVAKPVDPMFTPVCCIHCGEELQSTIGSIRAMVLKGWIETQVEGPIDPTTGNPVIRVRRVPSYATGRLCRPDQLKLTPTVGDNPPKRGEFQFLHERVKLRKRTVVTAGMARSLDLELKKEAEAKRWIDMGDVQIPAPIEEPEQVDVAAYRAFHKMGGRKRYDPDVNNTNATVKGGGRG